MPPKNSQTGGIETRSSSSVTLESLAEQIAARDLQRDARDAQRDNRLTKLEAKLDELLNLLKQQSRDREEPDNSQPHTYHQVHTSHREPCRSSRSEESGLVRVANHGNTIHVFSSPEISLTNDSLSETDQATEVMLKNDLLPAIDHDTSLGELFGWPTTEQRGAQEQKREELSEMEVNECVYQVFDQMPLGGKQLTKKSKRKRCQENVKPPTGHKSVLKKLVKWAKRKRIPRRMPKSWTFKYKSKLFQRNRSPMKQKKHYGKTWLLNQKQKFYTLLLKACFDSSDATSMVEEVDDLMEPLKKTWVILGINQMFHNLCFTWLWFSRYVVNGQVDMDLIYTCDSQLVELAKDAKTTKNPEYSQVLSATLSVILGWAEKRLLAYLDTIDRPNVVSMVGIVSLSVSTARILVDVISHEYRRRRKGEVDVARTKIETYIRSSLRTAFAQRMEKADYRRRASRNQKNPLPVLAILAKAFAELAVQEKRMFSSIWKRWHPFAARVAVVTLHVCYGNEINQFNQDTAAAVWGLLLAVRLGKIMQRPALQAFLLPYMDQMAVLIGKAITPLAGTLLVLKLRPYGVVRKIRTSTSTREKICLGSCKTNKLFTALQKQRLHLVNLLMVQIGPMRFILPLAATLARRLVSEPESVDAHLDRCKVDEVEASLTLIKGTQHQLATSQLVDTFFNITATQFPNAMSDVKLHRGTRFMHIDFSWAIVHGSLLCCVLDQIMPLFFQGHALTRVNVMLQFGFDVKALSIQLEGKLVLRVRGIDTTMRSIAGGRKRSQELNRGSINQEELNRKSNHWEERMKPLTDDVV